MTVVDKDVVDIMSIGQGGTEVILTISDHLDWTDSIAHQMLLQEKLNRYLAFVESGGLQERYAAGKGVPVVFRVVFKYQPDESGQEFIRAAQQVIEGAGFALRTQVSP